MNPEAGADAIPPSSHRIEEEPKTAYENGLCSGCRRPCGAVGDCQNPRCSESFFYVEDFDSLRTTPVVEW
jgi:hypothetical protein